VRSAYAQDYAPDRRGSAYVAEAGWFIAVHYHNYGPLSSIAAFACSSLSLVSLTPCTQVPDDYLVLDPFCGTGSTGEAALRCGRAFLGMDIDTAVCDTAVLRLAEVAGGLRDGRYPDERYQSQVRALYVHRKTIHHSAEVLSLIRLAHDLSMCLRSLTCRDVCECRQNAPRCAEAVPIRATLPSRRFLGRYAIRKSNRYRQ
jgi:hypothetical protein